MKKLLILLVLLGFCFTSYAELYIIVDTETQEIFTVSEKNDTVLPDGKELVILEGDFETYPFPDHPSNCKLINNKFIVNTEKVNKEYQDSLIAEEIAEEEAMVQEKMRKLAIDKLKEEGKVLKHVK